MHHPPAVRGAALTLLLLTSGGCGTLDREPVVFSGIPPLVLEMPARGVRQYNEPGPPLHRGPVADRLTRLVELAAAAVGREAPRRDARLDAVCTALAGVLPDDRVTPFELVEFALQHYGIIEPAPRLILATVRPQALAAFEASLARRLPALLYVGRYRRLGLGGIQRPEGARIVIALQDTFVWTAPIPREVPHNDPVRLVGTLDASFRRPRLYVGHPRGAVEELGLEAAPPGFRAEFRCRGRGRYQIELTAEDRYGMTVIANFPIYCGVTAPLQAAAPLGADTPVSDPTVAERRLLDLINDSRHEHSLPPLEAIAAITAVAREHSRDMAEVGYVGHVSPRRGDTASRLKQGRARVRIGRLRENVARAFSAEEAHRALWASPAHRANLLARDVTQVGIGVALGAEVAGRREIFITELLFSPPREVLPHEFLYITDEVKPE